MPRGQKRSNADKISSLQTRIDTHKSQIEILEKKLANLQKEIHSEAVKDLATFIEKKKLSVNDVKKLINQSSVTAKNPTKTVTNKNAMNTKMTTKRRVNKTAKVAESTTNQSNNLQSNM